jgi:hypothetical protein
MLRATLACLCVATLAGCANQIDEVCEARATCQGAPEQSEHACVLQGEAMRDHTEGEGCDETFQTYLECLGRTGQCVDGQPGKGYTYNCPFEVRDLEACSAYFRLRDRNGLW